MFSSLTEKKESVLAQAIGFLFPFSCKFDKLHPKSEAVFTYPNADLVFSPQKSMDRDLCWAIS